MQEQKTARARDKIGLQPLQLRRPVLDRCLYKREREAQAHPAGVVSRWTSSKCWKIRGKLVLDDAAAEGRGRSMSVLKCRLCGFYFCLWILYDFMHRF